MVIVQNENFSARQICMSGQCFRMEMCSDDKYCLIAAGKYLEISQRGMRYPLTVRRRSMTGYGAVILIWKRIMPGLLPALTMRILI